MRIGEFQEVPRKASTLDVYNREMRRFNLAVLLGTLVVVSVTIAFLMLW